MSRFGHPTLTPVLQKSESFRVKAPEGEVVVIYIKPSATQDLKFSGFPARVNNMAKSTPFFLSRRSSKSEVGKIHLEGYP